MARKLPAVIRTEEENECLIAEAFEDANYALEVEAPETNFYALRSGESGSKAR